MRIFGLNILTDRKMDEIIKMERHAAIQVPNKMISVILKKQATQPMIRQLLAGCRALHSENEFLRSKMKYG